MKKLTKINLRKLSQAELAEREQSILKGGACGCASVCWGDACGCGESSGGGFPSSSSNIAASGTGDDSSSSKDVWEGNSNRSPID